ncbi:MAG: Rne/Rng family ribonuclease [Candidatus Sulfopaludibacter sp.]|nr:Rne/Rng family ribonuclease [Candidatus Sulfopaludibacter sp.]
MSKELVISANRHETRVAVVEDDQVVELYHQRENEYSLAGSIHKGRVTRVLPGMQSAFVDIGLDRDAFLYVSDFFEDNDEYDKIVTSVEEKVLKLDRSPASVTAAPVVLAEPLPTVEGEPSAAEPEVTPAPVSAAAEQPVTPRPLHEGRREEGRRDDGRDDRRGGRRRRRRGQKGGGGRLPDSKFYSPRPGHEEAPLPASEPVAAAEPVAPPAEADDFFVLPGESLAKYKDEEMGDEQSELEAAPEPEPVGEFAVREAEPEPQPELESEPEAEPEPLGWQAAEPAVEAVVVTRVEEIAFPPEPELQAAVAEMAAEVELLEEVVVIVEPAPDEPETESEAESEAAAEALESAGNEAVFGEEEAAEETEGVDEGQAEGEAAVVDQEGPEPARIPTSLTATLREQGQNPRFLQHRNSRRMRRRGGRDRDGRDSRPAGEPRPPQGEVRTVPEPGPRPEIRTAPRPEKAGVPSISDLLKEGQEIIVQIAKEPLGQKGARITSHIALPGRFLVYMPTVDHIGVSRKIPSDDERLRLKRILQQHRTGIPGGYIVRTAGEGHTEEELKADMMFLYNMWLDMRQKAERRPAPLLIHHDLNVVERILRDQLTSSFKSIWVDNEEVYESVLGFVQRFQPLLVSRVKLYTRSTPIFDEFGITSELEKALRPKVWLKSGGYIVINQTEALVAIDINTGKYVGKSNRLEDTIVKTNTDAIKEIVRQIRLRDLGGIIVVDFIDMDERKNRQKVMQALEEAMRADRAPNKILQFNDFGLVAITRKRVKQSLERTLCTPCPYCEGAGYVKSPQTVVGEILQEANKIARVVEGKDVLLRVNPEVARMLKSNQNTFLQELEEILGRTVIVKSDPQLHQEKFDLA